MYTTIPKDIKQATSSPWEMNMALGKDFGTFISAITGINVEVDPNPAGTESATSPMSDEDGDPYRKD